LLVLAGAGCGSQASSQAQRVERSYDVAWRDNATSVDVAYATDRIAFHDGRWTANVTITNKSDKPLFQTPWRVGESWTTWNGPALVYSGLDVLGSRRLIYVPADREQPDIPSPLEPGKSWTGTFSGPIPAEPKLPRASDIWLRFPVFGIGMEWDMINPALAVQVISEQAVQL
jgi:hypothetical protein